jgi:hypothetical protein
MKSELERLRTLPELEPPEALDELVLSRALQALGTAPPAATPIPLPAAETLVYAAGVAAYVAHGAQSALRLVLRLIS